MKKLLIIISLVACVGMVSTVVALTSAQVNSILNMLAAFGVDSTTIANVELALRGEAVEPIQPTPSIPADCVGIIFTRNLAQGSVGNDVRCLQVLLNQSVDTQIASSGIGSAGRETTTFGLTTKAAVIKFQNKYAAEILTPVGLTVGTGFVGAATRSKLNNLYASYPREPEDPKPSINVLFPNGGERLTIGETYNIAWNANNVRAVNIHLENWQGQPAGGPLTWRIATEIPASLGEYSWMISDDSHLKIYSIGYYKIRVVDADDTSSYAQQTADSSDDYFSIIEKEKEPEDPKPSITVLFPNGGERLKIGEIYTIKWKSKDLPEEAQNRISISLYPEGWSPGALGVISLIGTTSNTGHYSSILPAGISPGKYKVKVGYFPPGDAYGPGHVEGMSSNYFNIVLPSNDCIRENPLVKIEPISATFNPGDYYDYSIFVKNNDSLACGSSRFNVSPTCPNELECETFARLPITVEPNQIYAVTLRIKSFEKTPPSNYSISAAAVNLGERKYIGTGKATFVVSGTEGVKEDIPFINGISPTSGTREDWIVISGKNLFGTRPSGIHVEFLKDGVQRSTIFSPIYEDTNGLFLKFQLSNIFVGMNEPGTYQVRVVNDYGKSNTIKFDIFLQEILVPGYNFYVKLFDNGTGNWSFAKSACKSLGDEWGLPTMQQLSILYQNKDKIGGFEDQAYWSSDMGMYIHFSNGFENYMNPGMTFPSFRCVRS